MFASVSERTLGKDDDRRVAVVLVDAVTPPAGAADPMNPASGRVADVRHVLWQEQAAEQAVGVVQIVGWDRRVGGQRPAVGSMRPGGQWRDRPCAGGGQRPVVMRRGTFTTGCHR